ncbi:MAG: zinc ribbon domain-containing protein [Planctomycetota bacterium]
MKVSGKGKRFCDIAVRERIITEEQALKCLRQQARDIQDGMRIQIGVYLMREGLVTPEQAEDINRLMEEAKRSAPAVESGYCPNCQTKLLPSAAVCDTCGYTINLEVVRPSAQPIVRILISPKRITLWTLILGSLFAFMTMAIPWMERHFEDFLDYFRMQTGDRKPEGMDDEAWEKLRQRSVLPKNESGQRY